MPFAARTGDAIGPRCIGGHRPQSLNDADAARPSNDDDAKRCDARTPANGKCAERPSVVRRNNNNNNDNDRLTAFDPGQPG